MRLLSLANALTRTALVQTAKAANHLITRGYTQSGVKVEAANCMKLHSAVNHQYVKAKVWSDTHHQGYVRLNLVGDHDRNRFGNSNLFMQGGVQTVLHDMSVCALIASLKRAGAHLFMGIKFFSPIDLRTTHEIEVVARISHEAAGHVFVESDLFADNKLSSKCSHVVRAKPITPNISP